MFLYVSLSLYFSLIYYLNLLNFHQESEMMRSYKDDYTVYLEGTKNETHYPINPSLMYDNNSGNIWGTVRVTNDHKCNKTKVLKEYTSEVQIIDKLVSVDVFNEGELEWCVHKTFRRRGSEDPRSFMWGNKRYSLITIVGKEPVPCSNKIYMYSIEDKSIRRLYSPFSNNRGMEKNWVPFINNGKLLIEYFVNPRKIFYIDGEKVEQTLCPTMSIYLHGSVPPVRVGDYYIGMAHSTPNYMHVFYLFESEPPFRILRFSKYFFLSLENTDQNDYEFVTGMSYLESKNRIMLSYTINDCINKVNYLDVDEIISSMQYRCKKTSDVINNLMFAII